MWNVRGPSLCAVRFFYVTKFRLSSILFIEFFLVSPSTALLAVRQQRNQLSQSAAASAKITWGKNGTEE